MATMPTFVEGKLIGPVEWNDHANQINSNTDGLAAGNTRITTLETNQGTKGANGTVYGEIDTLKTNQGTRGSHGAIYSEIGTLKTNQGTRGTRGDVYAELNAIRAEVFGDAARTTKPMVKLRLNTNQVFNYATDTMLNWQLEDFDSASMHAGTDQHVTIPVAGRYLNVVTINLGPDEDGAGTRAPDRGALGVKLLLNSTDPNPGPSITAATATAPFNSAGEGPIVTMAAVSNFAASDVLRISGWHNFSLGDNATVGNRLNMTLVPGPFEAVGTTWSCVYLGK